MGRMVLQCGVHRLGARIRVMRMRKEFGRALIVQCWWRGLLAYKCVSIMAKMCSVKVILRFIQCHLLHGDHLDKIAAISQVQIFVRMQVKRRSFGTFSSAAAMLQEALQMTIVRLDYVALKEGVVELMRRMKNSLIRLQYNDLKRERVLAREEQDERNREIACQKEKARAEEEQREIKAKRQRAREERREIETESEREGEKERAHARLRETEKERESERAAMIQCATRMWFARKRVAVERERERARACQKKRASAQHAREKKRDTERQRERERAIERERSARVHLREEEEQEREEKCARALESEREREIAQLLRMSVVMVQCATRMWFARKRKAVEQQQQQEEALEIASKEEEERIVAQQKSTLEFQMILVLQCATRMCLARKHVDAARIAAEGLYVKLVRARPDLLEKGLFRRAGIGGATSAFIINLLRGMENNPAMLQTRLYQHLDEHALELLKSSVAKIEKGVAQMGASAHAQRFPLDINLLKNPQNHLPFSEETNPWLDIAYAVLGSPMVHFTPSHCQMAWTVGLQLVIETWKKAQIYRDPHKAQTNRKQASATKVQRWFRGMSRNRLKPIVLSDDHQAIETGEKYHLCSMIYVFQPIGQYHIL